MFGKILSAILLSGMVLGSAAFAADAPTNSNGASTTPDPIMVQLQQVMSMTGPRH